MGVLPEIFRPLLADFLSHTPHLGRILVAFSDNLDDPCAHTRTRIKLVLISENTDPLCPRLERLSFGSPTLGYIWYNFPALWFAPLRRGGRRGAFGLA